jgi:hypothetical protein
MKHDQILKKSVEKAIKNGWEVRWGYYKGDKEKMIDFMLNDYDAPYYLEFIFSHDFAKAFWGENKHSFEGTETCKICNYYDEVIKVEYCWQYHLQQMVIEEKPLKYIEKFLEK